MPDDVLWPLKHGRSRAVLHEISGMTRMKEEMKAIWQCKV